MSQRRTLIGVLIGILVFALVNLVDKKTWISIETSLLTSESGSNSAVSETQQTSVIYFNPQSQAKFINKTLEDQKIDLLFMLSELGKYHPKSINYLESDREPFSLSKQEIQQVLESSHAQVEILNYHSIDESWANREKPLNTNFYDSSSLEDDDINPAKLKDHHILFISPYSTKHGLQKVINFVNNKKSGFYCLSGFDLLLPVLLLSIFFTNFVHWARVVGFFVFSTVVLIISQISSSYFGAHLGITNLVLCAFAIVFIASIFDIDFQNINFRDFFTEPLKPLPIKLLEPVNNNLIEVEILNDLEKTLREKISFELKQKYFNQIERNFEELVLNFEESTAAQAIAISDELIEITNNNRLSEKERTRFDFIKVQFNNLISQIDAVLFGLVPFRFEGEQGLINILEIYASKIFSLSKGRIQINIESELPVVKLDLNKRINIFRILQNLIELIKNTNSQSSGLRVEIRISQSDDKLKFTIRYDGLAIKKDELDLKLQDSFKRLSLLEQGELEFSNEARFNQVELRFSLR